MSADAVQKMDNALPKGILTVQEAEITPCEWNGTARLLNHQWCNTVDGYQRCENCKHVRVKPNTFEQWWDTEVRFGRLFLGSGDYWVSKGIAKKAWVAAKESR